ncbi:MAG: general secretion pathway protein GspK [Sedimentisphaerales bacterium]|nr:general secretion pathway protein GspK [Sedimentisphaerales bacterium]
MAGCKSYNPNGRRPGIVLLVTLVLLVVLSTVSYTLSARVLAQRHRDQYIIDYSQARYSCDSAVKYALASLEDLEPELISRPNVPDFSDLFAMDEEAYQELLTQLAEQAGYLTEDEDSGSLVSYSDLVESMTSEDVNDGDVVEGTNNYDPLDSIKIPGPYGPAWPLVAEPAEFELGSAKVTIEIEDEEAKYPLGWALLGDEKLKREAQAGFETFCEWMSMNRADIEWLEDQLKTVGEIKPFEIEFKPKTTIVRTSAAATAQPATPEPSSKYSTAQTRTRRTPLTRIRRKTVSVQQQIDEQSTFYAKLFHSSMLDTETLARPLVKSTMRDESVLKYLGTWASMKVNINTAPRHVLETAFMFGGDAARIADEVIRRRRVKPFEDIKELKESMYGYNDSIEKCEKFITTQSNFFTIRVTAVSGGAKASSVIAISKDNKKVQRIAVINI